MMGSDTEVQAAPAEAPAPEPAAPAAAASGGGKGIIIAVLAIVVVIVVIVAFMYMGTGSVEGKWTFDEVEVYDEDGTLNETASTAFEADQNGAWIEFKSDGTAAMGDADGAAPFDDPTYVTDGDELTLTYSYEMESYSVNSTTGNITWDNQTITDTMDYTFTVSGSTLNLEFDMDGKTVKISASKE